MFSDAHIDALRSKVAARLSEKRFTHVLGVEACAIKLAKLFMSDKTNELRAAALLHDVTKELPTDEQLKLLASEKFNLTDEDMKSKQLFHSFTAPIIVRHDFPEFATADILSAVFKHTVGDSEMSIFDKIIFISDYVEDNRTFDSCIKVRELLFNGIEELDASERIKRLDKACLASVNGTIKALEKNGSNINSRIFITKKNLEKQILQN